MIRLRTDLKNSPTKWHSTAPHMSPKRALLTRAGCALDEHTVQEYVPSYGQESSFPRPEGK
jgi:hypothetical protein